jgi:RND family efflux transporter MFP subunit
MDRSDLKWYFVGAGILVGAAAIMFVLYAFAPQAETSEPPPQSPRVSTTPVEVRAGSLLVRGTGTVQPAREIQLTAEVGGRLADVSDALVSGGRFAAGETLARIDPSDYRSALKQAEAQVTQAKFQLLQAREEAGAARANYERVRERAGAAPAPDSTELGRFVFNEPQVAQAEANLQSAKASLETARTNLERTRLQVPFDGMVRQKQADLGAYLAPGTPVATVYGTEAAEIVVSLPTRKAALIRNLWATTGQQSGAELPATLTTTYGGEEFAWQGRVHRVEGAVSEQTRTVDVVVRVPDPYDQAMRVQSQRPERPPAAERSYAPERPPLAVGTYTEVDIQGRQDGTYHVVPRRAVHTRTPDQPPVVWTVQGDSMLVERSVEPIQTVEEQTYLAPTLDPDTRVITTDLRVQTDSMAVRVSR